MDQNWLLSFREKLDQYYSWPSLYMFKFIVPIGKEKEVSALFPQQPPTEKLSKNGNYVSVTVQMTMPSSEAVMDVYVRAAEIEGLIAL